MRFCTSCVIFHEFCEKLQFEVSYAKLQRRRISEALSFSDDQLKHTLPEGHCRLEPHT